MDFAASASHVISVILAFVIALIKALPDYTPIIVGGLGFYLQIKQGKKPHPVMETALIKELTAEIEALKAQVTDGWAQRDHWRMLASECIDETWPKKPAEEIVKRLDILKEKENGTNSSN